MIKYEDIKVGDKLVVDAGFTCLNPGVHVVEKDEDGLFIKCICGHHYLDGQIGSEGQLIGLSK